MCELDKNCLNKNKLKNAADVLIQAFMDHEVPCYIQPDRNKRYRAIEILFSGTCKITNSYGHLQTDSEQVNGVFTWFPPGTYPVSFWQMLKTGGLISPFIAGIKPSLKILKSINFIDKIKIDLLKGRPYWYLAFAGILPEMQGKHIGTNMINKMHSHLDKNKEISILEANSEKSVRFWKRSGYRVIAEHEIPGGGVKYWFMARNFD